MHEFVPRNRKNSIILLIGQSENAVKIQPLVSDDSAFPFSICLTYLQCFQKNKVISTIGKAGHEW